MSISNPTTPSFVFGYWRPWNESSNVFNSYLDYIKDTGLVKYGADTVGSYMQQVSREQLRALRDLRNEIGEGFEGLSRQLEELGEGINELGVMMVSGMEIISSQLTEVNQRLNFINRQLDVQIEQQHVSNLLLKDIVQLLRVPDSEKERQHAIELGLKFFVNAQNDPDLFADALSELLRAETLMRQDYFVLHRIGCIYLYASKHIDPNKAYDYFLRAAKYASVESTPGAVRHLSSELKSAVRRIPESTSDVAGQDFGSVQHEDADIKRITADSYEKAAFAAYVAGRFEEAVNCQNKSLKLNPNPADLFTLSKYQVRNKDVAGALKSLNLAVDQAPQLSAAVFKEVDLFNEPEVINLLRKKSELLNERIDQLIAKWETIETTNVESVVVELEKIKKIPYRYRINRCLEFERKAVDTKTIINKEENEIDELIIQWKQTQLAVRKPKELEAIFDSLKRAKDLPLESMRTAVIKFKKELDELDSLMQQEQAVEELIFRYQNGIFKSYKKEDIENYAQELIESKNLPLPQMRSTYEKLKRRLELDILKIGDAYAGGLVFYLDDSLQHGLICSTDDIGEAPWGGDGELETETKFGSGMENTKLIVENVSYYINELEKPPTNFGHLFWYFFGFAAFTVKGEYTAAIGLTVLILFGFPKRFIYYSRVLLRAIFGDTHHPAMTAARMCQELRLNGYSDWYLPSLKELQKAISQLGYRFSGSERYWTSSEKGEQEAYCCRGVENSMAHDERTTVSIVCAIRKF